MQKLIVKGKKHLTGIIPISGSKNASLPILAASILTNKVFIKNIPLVKDISTLIDLLRFIAAFTVAISHLFINKAGINVNLEIISSMAVEVFFIISGFVLAPQIIKLTEKKKFIDTKILLRNFFV